MSDKKRLLVLFADITLSLAVLAAILLTGCGTAVHREAQPKTSRFMELERANRWLIVADKETGVMYSVSNGGYNQGIFTLLVDENGAPLVWEGESE